MGVYVDKTPIRLWIDPDYIEDETDCVSKVKVLDRDVQYIRADIVDEMREALVTMIEAYRGEFGSHWGEQCEEETEEHDEVMKARAALKRLEEE